MSDSSKYLVIYDDNDEDIDKNDSLKAENQTNDNNQNAKRIKLDHFSFDNKLKLEFSIFIFLKTV